MRGRTGPSSSSSSSSSSVGPPPNRMALRKHVLQDVADVPSGSQRSDHNTQEGGAPDDHRDDRDDELSSPLLPRSPRERRRREKDNKAKEMTEDEMMDLALRLSEQEASMTASRMQKEEEAVMKAIEESMGESQTRACAPLAGPEAALRLCSRRKLSYSNRKQEGVSCSPHATELNGEGREAADDSRSLKRKRRAGSPLLEMPDLSQTQKISQDSACSSDPLDLQPDSQQVSLDLQPDSQQVSLDLQPDSQQVSLDLQLDSQQVSLDLQPDSQQVSLDLQPDSQQSCDSTQIDEGRSPVFPSTGCRAEVLVPRLSQNLLQSCRTSGFVLCSQDSSDDPLKSPQAQTRSPTFPQREPAVFSETEQVDDSETQLSPEGSQSPVFGRTTQHQKSQSACRLQVCNSGFKSSSQESLSSSVRSCRPRSPVFPRILDLHETLPPPDRSGVCTSPVFSDEQAEQGPVGSLSRVLDRTGKRTKIQRATAQIREDKKTDPAPGVTCHVTPSSDEELTEVIRDSSETELSSDMKLLWSDDDDADVTPAAVASPSPVFPEERAVDRADGQTASLNHTTGTNGGDCSQQTSTSERDPHLLSCQAAVSRSAGGGTVHYYWGVPFCPRGLNPDSYTQVILAQMEVYEKSLKQAQRCLLRKVEWGEAVLPQIEKSPLPESMSPEPSDPPEPDVPQRRLLRKRRNRLSEDVDDSPAAEEKEQEDKTDGEEEEEEKVTTEEEKKSDGGGGGQGDSDDCEVCPETQLSHEEDDDRTQDLMMDTDAGAQIHPKGPESPLRDERAEEEEMETDAPAPSSISNAEGGQAVSNGEEEVKGGRLQRSPSPEPDVVPQSPKTSVDCPICQGSFPVSQIEMHAAYCDGEVAVIHERRPRANCCQDSLKPRRKRTRRIDVTEEENSQPSNSAKNTEKCYVCLRDVPLRDFGRHTELCIQRQESKTAARGRLLSALEHTDGRDSEAGPSGSKPVTGEVIDLLDDDDEEEGDGVPAPRVSDSPIRAFTPISEAADCLIDFKKQKRVKKPGQRRR